MTGYVAIQPSCVEAIQNESTWFVVLKVSLPFCRMTIHQTV